jgi:hypothetical protein
VSGVYRALGRQALCCGCGNVRKIDGRSRGYRSTEELDRNPDRWRMTLYVGCIVCQRHTTHAALRRADDPDRDEAEVPAYDQA